MMELKVSLVALMKVFKAHYEQVKISTAAGMHVFPTIEIRRIIPGTNGRLAPDMMLYDLDNQQIVYIDSWEWENMIEGTQQKAKEKHENKA